MDEFQSVVGANGISYDIVNRPFTIAAWKSTIIDLHGLEYNNSEDDGRVHAFRRYFAEFARQRWDIVLIAAAIYLMAVFFLPRLIFGSDAGNGESRFRAKVNTPFALWNGLLAIFSIWGTYNTALPFFSEVFEDGYICRDPFTRNPAREFGTPGVALVCFIFSKLPELCDTFFLILKNRPVRLLQWYHHVSVMLFCWHAIATEYAPGLWFALMNFAVHSVMYSYFGIYTQFKGSRKYLKKIGPFVTLMQTSQMVVGVFVNAIAAHAHLTGSNCHVIDSAVYMAIAMYFSYFLLFAKLFYDSVVKAKKVVTEKCCKPKGQHREKAE